MDRGYRSSAAGGKGPAEGEVELPLDTVRPDGDGGRHPANRGDDQRDEDIDHSSR